MANVTVTSVMSCENAAMMCYEDRLSTFVLWPSQIVPNKFQLAKAGFYYMEKGDEVICFACAIKLNSWERTNVPLDEHFKWQPNCIFLKMIGYESSDTSDRFNNNANGLHGGFRFPPVRRPGNFSNQT